MKKKKIYNIDLSEFSDLIDNMRIELKSKDLEYKKLELSKEECKILQKLVSIYIDILGFEEKELFLLGCKNAHLYNKNIEIIRD